MAAPYTDLTALANLVQTAYDQKVRLALRSVPSFRAIADTKPVQQTQPGSTVVFNIHQDLLPVTAPLGSDSVDPAGVALSNTTPVTVVLNEYGNYTVVTKALKEFSLDAGLDSNIANIIAFNLADSVDRIIAGTLASTTNIITEEAGALTVTGASVDGVTQTDTIKGRDITIAVAKLREASVIPFDGVSYVAYINPVVARDLRAETGESGWRYIAGQTDTTVSGVLAGEIGTYEGVRFIETPRVPIEINATAVKVYSTFVLGREALAEAVAEEFSVVANGTVVDPLKRKMPIGWYGIAGWSLFRPEALWAVKTASSVDAA